MFPVPSWSLMNARRSPISIGLANCPGKSARMRVNGWPSATATQIRPAMPPR